MMMGDGEIWYWERVSLSKLPIKARIMIFHDFQPHWKEVLVFAPYYSQSPLVFSSSPRFPSVSSSQSRCHHHFPFSLYNLPQNSSSKEGGSLPVSLHCPPLPLSWQVVQEYERAVIFRLGRLLSGAAKGPVLKDTSKNHEKCLC